MLLYEPEPELTDAFQSRGFVVKREERDHGHGNEDVVLHTTLSASDIFHAISWYQAGPTAVADDVRIVWEDKRREQVLADAEHPTEYAEPEVPEDPFVVVEHDGWRAVVPSDRVITTMIQRRGDAKYHGFEILEPVGLPLEDATECDLVEVDADPEGNRQPNRSDV